MSVLNVLLSRLRWRGTALTAVLLCYTAVALPRVADAPLGRDSWRESDVLMVGRNFCREQAPLWLPRIDARGDGTGITGMELPILNYLHGFAACHGFDQVTTARLVALVFALLAALAVFALARRVLPWPSSLVALGLFLFSPLMVHYGRGIQPDVPSLALGLVALWTLCLHVERRSLLMLGLSAIAMGFGVLIKLPIVVLGLPALFILWERNRPQALLMPRYLAYAAIALVPAILWYAHARALQDTYGLHYFYLGKSLAELADDWTRLAFYRGVLGKLGDVYTLPFLALIVASTIAWRWRELIPWLRGLAVATIAYVFLAGHHAAVHYYYGIPLLPLLALGGGLAFAELGRWLSGRRLHAAAAAVIAVTMLHGVWRSSGWSPGAKMIRDVDYTATLVRARLDPAATVVLVSEMDPTLLWFIDRKGWVTSAAAAPELLAHRPDTVALDKPRVGPDAVKSLESLFVEHGFAPIASGKRMDVWGR